MARGGRRRAEVADEIVHSRLELVGVAKSVYVVSSDIVAIVCPSGADAVVRPREHGAENVHRHRKPVALVRARLARRAERQKQEVVRDGGALHNRRSVRRADDARRQQRARPPRVPNFVDGNDARGHIEHPRRLLERGGGDGDRVGAEARNPPERRERVGAGGRHAHADHIALQRQHRVVGRHADVPAVEHRHDADAAGARLLHRDLHRLRSDDHAEPAVAVNVRRRGALADDPPVGSRVLDAVGIAIQVDAEHIGDAVAVHAAQVGRHEHVGGEPSVGGGNALLFNEGGGRGAQRLGGNADGVLIRDEEGISRHRIRSGRRGRRRRPPRPRRGARR